MNACAQPQPSKSVSVFKRSAAHWSTVIVVVRSLPNDLPKACTCKIGASSITNERVSNCIVILDAQTCGVQDPFERISNLNAREIIDASQ